MDTSVRETLCSKCLHCQVCGHKKDYLAMVKRLEELFYSVPEEDRPNMALQDPACKFNQKKLEVPSFVNQRSMIRTPKEIFEAVDEYAREDELQEDILKEATEAVRMGGL